MVIALYMYVAGCFTINNLQTWIGRFDWLILINKAKYKHLEIFKVYDILDKIFQKTAIMVASMVNRKKKYGLKPKTINNTKNLIGQ